MLELPFPIPNSKTTDEQGSFCSSLLVHSECVIYGSIFIIKMRIDVCTVGKVGSSSIFHSVKNKEGYVANHYHSLKRLKDVITENKEMLLFVGCRNPIERNVSYFFQNYNLPKKDNIETKENGYEGYMCYIPKLLSMKTEDAIDIFKKKAHHHILDEWFEEFFALTKIKDLEFDKDAGMSIFEIGNIKLVLYTLEKLNDNEEKICNLINVDKLVKCNTSDGKKYKRQYASFKSQIIYSEEYIDKILYSETTKYFYSEDDLARFKRNYV